MVKLYLDDIRTPKNSEFKIVRSYNEFIKWIKLNGMPDYISFDHDLGDNNVKTGYDAAKWLGEYCIENNIPLPDYNVHSANPIGAANIEIYLSNVKRFQNQHG